MIIAAVNYSAWPQNGKDKIIIVSRKEFTDHTDQ